MPAHDIIDNRSEKLTSHLNRILGTSDKARFAVGYLFLSGLTAVADRMLKLQELRLLIGNTSNRETIELLAEGFQHLQLTVDEVERQTYIKRTESAGIVGNTAQNLKNTIELMDQTDSAEQLIAGLIRMIHENRLKVRIYTKGRLHAKAYICDYGKVFDAQGRETERHEKGIAVIGSSNLTLAGLTHNTELNVVVQGNDNHDALVEWFEPIWNEAMDFDAALMTELKSSWAAAAVTPYDIYLKTLYELVRDRLESEDEPGLQWDDDIFQKLAVFQKNAVLQAVQMIRDYGGAFVADVVGLGKSYIGAAIVKQFERTGHVRPLIVCPAPLVEMWERYNEVYQLNARVLSMGYLREDATDGPGVLLNDYHFKDRDFVLIDESHNFRHPDTQRYKIMQAFLNGGRRCCLLTATPRNKSAWDVYYQMKLFHPDDRTDLPVDPPNLKEYFQLVDRSERNLPDILPHILIRRTRNHILKWYGMDSQTNTSVDPNRFQEYMAGARKAYIIVGGKAQFFPKRTIETIEYNIEDAYQGLYQKIRIYLGKPRTNEQKKPGSGELTYARYGLWRYVNPEKQRREPYNRLQRAGVNLRGLMRILLFKRFESSVHAFRETIRRLLGIHEHFLASLDTGIVPAGEEAQIILYASDLDEESHWIDALRKASEMYNAADFDLKRLRKHIEQDIGILKEIAALVEPITPKMDAKLQTLLNRLKQPPLKNAKVLIFTQYADTAKYLYENLDRGAGCPESEVIFSGEKSKQRVVGRFAPRANPEYRFGSGETEIMRLVATDVLAEGLNLQDCDNIINYDLHWNPVRLIQRFGRIDRIGSEHEQIHGYNFLPETGIEANLKLREKLTRRIQEIHDTIGEDSEILDTTERLNPEAFYAIYETEGGEAVQLGLFEQEEDEYFDLNEAEEFFRQMKKDNLLEYERIVNLRDGIRSAREISNGGIYVFCRAGNYRKLYLLDETNRIVSTDLTKVLAAVKCAPEEKATPIPVGYNDRVMAVRKLFSDETRSREAEKKYSTGMTHGQLYVLRELRIQFDSAKDDETRQNAGILEKVFRGPVTDAIKRELNALRRNGVNGQDLMKSLIRIYDQHNIKDAAHHRTLDSAGKEVARVVCSEG